MRKRQMTPCRDGYNRLYRAADLRDGFNRLYVILIISALLFACSPTEVPENNGGITATPTGTLRFFFKIAHPWIPTHRIVRAELHVAKDGTEIFKGNYFQSANVTSFQDTYFFYLPPGTYYYEAVIACICEGDSCSAGGFPGNKFGTKHTMGKFNIQEDKVLQIIPIFQ